MTVLQKLPEEKRAKSIDSMPSLEEDRPPPLKDEQEEEEPQGDLMWFPEEEEKEETKMAEPPAPSLPKSGGRGQVLMALFDRFRKEQMATPGGKADLLLALLRNSPKTHGRGRARPIN